MQHMVLSLSTRVRGGLSMNSRRVTISYAACIQLYPEDYHSRIETCRWK